jgi:hypothetical protein
MDNEVETPGRKSLCACCHKRPGTKRWVGEGGAMALSHGFYEMWCEGCVLRKQIEHAQERAAAIPDLEQQLEDWLLADGFIVDDGMDV